MRKLFLTIMIILVLVGIFFSLKFYINNKESDIKELPNEKVNFDDNGGGRMVSREIGESGGSGGSIDSGVSGDSNWSGNGENTEIEEPSCLLVRPGDVPGMYCSVNYITSKEVSLKLRNEFGNDVGVKIILETCSPEMQDLIKNNQEKDFVFSCDNENYFNQGLIIVYEIEENEIIIPGFIIGSVS